MPIDEEFAQQENNTLDDQSSPQPSKGSGPGQIRFSASASFRAADLSVNTPGPTPIEPFIRDWEGDLAIADGGHYFAQQPFHHPEDRDPELTATRFPSEHRKITGEFLSVPAFSARQTPAPEPDRDELPFYPRRDLAREITNPDLPLIILPGRQGRKADAANEAPIRAFGLLAQAISQIATTFPNDLGKTVEETDIFKMIFAELEGDQITQEQASELIERLATALNNSPVSTCDSLEQVVVITGDEVEIIEDLAPPTFWPKEPINTADPALPPPERTGTSRVTRMISQELRLHSEADLARRLTAKKALTVIMAGAILVTAGIMLRQNTENPPKKAATLSHKKPEPKALPDIAKEIANMPRPKELTPEKKQPVVETQVSTIKQAVVETMTSTITLPIIKEENSSGKVSFDEERSKEEWVKLGYSVTVKLAAGGRRYFEVSASDGNSFEVNVFLVGKNQSTIEGKKIQKDTH